jgi:hypothetical protein
MRNMSPFEFFKEHCGGRAWIFVAAMGLLFALLTLAAFLEGIVEETRDRFPQGAWVIAVAAAVLVVAPIWAAISRKRARRREKLENRPLSHNEWRVARSKLLRDRRDGA